MPVRVVPKDDESLTSWMDRIAGHFNLTTGETLRGLGLLAERSQRIPLFGVLLADEHYHRISALTGVAPNRVHLTLLARFGGSAIDLAGLTTGVAAGQVASREWALFWGSRACPACLHDSGGAWSVWWKLGLAVACPIHRLVLIDTCPACGKPIRRGTLGRGPATLSTVPRRTICGERTATGTCDFDLATAECVVSDERLTHAQLRVWDRVAARDRRWIVAVREAVALVRRLACPGDLWLQPTATTSAFAREAELRDRLRRKGEPAASYTTLPPSVAALAAVLPTAVDVVDAENADDSVGWLVEIARRAGFEGWRFVVDQLGFSSVVADNWRTAVRPHVGFSGAGRRCAAGAGIQARHIPQAAPDEEWERIATNVPGTAIETGRTFLALAAVRAVEGCSWAAAGERLGLDEAMGVRIGDVVARRVLDHDMFWAAVTGFVRRLAVEPADYRLRRDRLETLWEIDESWLTDTCKHLGILRGYGVRRRYAAGWVWCEVTGGLFCNSPAWAMAVETGARPDSLRQSYRRFCLNVPTALGAELLEKVGGLGPPGSLSHPIDMVSEW